MVVHQLISFVCPGWTRGKWGCKRLTNGLQSLFHRPGISKAGCNRERPPSSTLVMPLLQQSYDNVSSMQGEGSLPLVGVRPPEQLLRALVAVGGGGAVAELRLRGQIAHRFHGCKVLAVSSAGQRESRPGVT